jgi:hypothetical protein
MTIAIGTCFDGGVIVCADTRVVATDGATTSDSKLFASLSPKGRLFLIADAAEDANAAKMLGREISSAICDVENPYEPGPAIKAAMTTWHSSYHHFQPPNLQFLIASVVVGNKSGQVFLCEPPSTVAFGWPIAIGRGARAVEPRISILGPYAGKSMDAKSALLRLGYLMFLAKRDEASACGGNTHTIVASVEGGIALIDDEEMEEAEKLAKEMDSALIKAIETLASCPQKNPAQKLSETFHSITEKYEKAAFPSLKMLEKLVLPKRNLHA